MSIWGKIIGGVAGFAVGGPLGALMGAVAGHAVDRLRESGPAADIDELEDTRQVAFTIAVIALGAKLAKADGVVTRDEIAAFKRIFRVPPHEMKNIGRLFNEARQDAAGFEPYAEQIERMFRGNPAVLEELLSALFLIAKANDTYHPAQKTYLRRVAAIFGFDDKTFRRIESVHFGAGKDDPYGVLGVPRTVSDAALKAAYRKLVRENHPDALTAQGMPKEFVDLANEKLAAINAAYDRVRKERGLS